MRNLSDSTHFVSGRFQGGPIDILAYACEYKEAEEYFKFFSQESDFSDLYIGETENAGCSDLYDTEGEYHRVKDIFQREYIEQKPSELQEFYGPVWEEYQFQEDLHYSKFWHDKPSDFRFFSGNVSDVFVVKGD